MAHNGVHKRITTELKDGVISGTFNDAYMYISNLQPHIYIYIYSVAVSFYSYTYLYVHERAGWRCPDYLRNISKRSTHHTQPRAAIGLAGDGRYITMTYKILYYSLFTLSWPHTSR